MTDSSDGGGIGLAEFLEDLRAELDEARARTANEPLKLGVEEIEVSLDVEYHRSHDTGGEVRAKGRFLIFAEAGASASTSMATERVQTQHLTLKLKPRLEGVGPGGSGTTTSSLDVRDTVREGEEQVPIPDLEPDS